MNPTSNHNIFAQRINPSELYIFWILHQTTTLQRMTNYVQSCISFESYIKPQRGREYRQMDTVVYLLNPTSNHNSSESGINACFVVYLLNPTSNHNLKSLTIIVASVVYLLNPTSNHNGPGLRIRWPRLYIFWILHQTTTAQNVVPCGRCCIYFESYIKPQLLKLSWIIGSVVYLLNPTLNHNFIWYINERSKVVYLLNPTSNHNVCPRSPTLAVLYIFWILHQTTTGVWSPLQQK